MMRTYDILTFGDTCIDLLMSGRDVVPEFGQVEKLVDQYTIELGGSCCIFACQAAKLGLRVGILGRVGDDMFGRLVIERLQACGVDTTQITVDPTLHTGVSVGLAQGSDRAILTYLGTNCAVQPADVTDAFLASGKHLHHGSFFLHTNLRPHMPTIMRRAHGLGLTTSLDTNWDPEDAWGWPLAETLAQTDIAMPNEQEALRITRSQSLDEAVERLRAQSSLIALKRGADGALLYTPDATYAAPPLPLVSGGDSVGAGDSFDAGFLAGWLRGLAPDVCLAIGGYCGRAVAAAVGGLQGQPTWAEVTAALDLPHH